VRFCAALHAAALTVALFVNSWMTLFAVADEIEAGADLPGSFAFRRVVATSRASGEFPLEA
jgi:hypothetical protein